jgi:hypothetical protein
MKTPRLYRKLASAHQFGVARGGWLSLHAAPDHLLLRKSSAFTETYRRFYFGDIEAITISETVRGIFWNSIFAFGLFMSVLPVLLQPAPHLMAGSFAVLFTILLVSNVARGTTCRTQLQTRVQTQSLPLRRVRKALRVANELRSNIDAAQAGIVGQATPAAALEGALVTHAAVPSATPPALRDDGDDAPPTLPWIQVATFVVLMLSAIVAMLAGHKVPLVYCVLAFVLANVGLAITALIQQRAKRLPKRPGAVVWISLVGHAIGFPIAYGLFTAIAGARKSASATSQVAPVMPTMQEIVWVPGFAGTLFAYGICCLLLGVIGAGLLATDPSRHQSLKE